MKPAKTAPVPVPAAPTTFSGSIEPLAGNEVLTKPVAAMTVPERTQAHAILNFMKKRVEARLKELREPLLADAQLHGEQVVGTDGKPTGSKKLYVEGSKVLDKVTVDKEPEYTKMTDLLAKKKIDIEKAYDKVATFIYNPSKVENLITTGFLKREEVEALKKVVHALTVDASPELAALLEAAGPAALPEG